MKRLSIFLVVALFELPMMAQSVQNTFYGCTLGKSSQLNTLMMMSKQGFKVDTMYNNMIVYAGNFEVENMHFSKCVTTFLYDTLSLVFFGAEKTTIDSKAISSLKNKYVSIPKTMSDNVFFQMIRDSLLAPFGADTSMLWSRVDENATIAIMDKDDAVYVTYIASTYLIDKVIAAIAEMEVAEPQHNEANRVKAVVGCEFGDSRQNVKTKFRPRASEYLSSDSHEDRYAGVTIGGLYFKRGTLYFINDQFACCSFETEFYTWKHDEAKRMYESICALYNKKYTNGMEIFQEEDHKTSVFGMLQDDYTDGIYPPIQVTFTKSLSRGGETYYYVTLSYFINRLEKLYNDEI